MLSRLRVISFLLLAGFLVCEAAPVPQRVRDYAAAHTLPGEVPGAMAVDGMGYTYLAGVQTAGHAAGSVYAVRIDPAGERRLYTAYLPASGMAQVTGAAVDGDGNLYIAGYTSSRNFPSDGDVQKTSGGRLDTFVAKLDPKGESWLWATYLGGSGDDLASAIAVDSHGNVYITGSTDSADFPAKGATLRETSASARGFLAEISADGGTLLYAGDLGGNVRAGRSIAVDAAGSVFIAGRADEGAFLLKTGGSGSGYLRMVDATAVEATAIALGAQGGIYLAGRTGDQAPGVFAAKYTADGERVYYTAIAGMANETSPAIAADAQGNAYVAGGRPATIVKLSAAGDRQISTTGLPTGNARALGVSTTGTGRAILAGAGARPYVARIATCDIWLSQAAQTISSAGGAASITVDTAPECGWTPAAGAPWIAASGAAAGHGQLSYRVAPNRGPARMSTISVGDETLTITQSAGTGAMARRAIRDNPGFRANALAACDDCSSPRAIDLGFAIDFYGRSFSQIWVNANGNVTFDAPNAAYTPRPLGSVHQARIAPFWADGDTRTAGAITYGRDAVDGRAAFGITWTEVGPYAGADGGNNTFQLVLIDRSDLGAGRFDIEMNFAGLAWDTGEASGHAAARAGFTNGSGQPGTWLELAGSGERGALIEGGRNGLEGRHTFSIGTANSLSPANSSADAAAMDKSGAAARAFTGLRPRAATGTITEFPVAISGSLPVAITTGPDAALWFADNQGFIGRMTTTGAVSSAPDNDANHTSIVFGPDGALWFTDTGNSKIGRMTTQGVLIEYATPTTNSAPHYITAGPDGNLWFTEFSVGKIGRITPQGAITEFDLPHNFDEPEGIVTGPDGALWFAEFHPSANNIGRITTGGKISEFPIPTAGAGANGIAVGSDHNLWFTEFNGNKIGQVDTSGNFHEFTLASAGSQPLNIVAGADGALWFTQRGTNQIGTITTGGSVAEYLVPTANALPAGITAGPDGAIWFTESNRSKIGQVVTAATNPPVLSIAKTHTGNFTAGEQGATFTVTVSNNGTGPTAGTVTVTESLPAGLTLVSMAGGGWACPNGGPVCTRSDALAGGASYSAITVTVNVEAAATSPQVNLVSVTGGGSSAVAVANDPATIDAVPALGTITEFPTPISSSEPFGIAKGPDNALWFTDLQGFIGRMTANGSVTEAPDNDVNQISIVTGPDGALWFTDTGNNKIGRITTAGLITEYGIPTSGGAPHYIVVGTDGNLWFTEFGVGRIGRITPAGDITEFALAHTFDEPQGIAVGPDGALWFTEYHPSANNIGRITTAGVISEFALPTAGANAIGIATGPDGNLWFTEFTGNKIGQMTPDGVFTEFPLTSAGSQPENIVLGPDGALWFTQRASGQIGRITTGGLISEYNIPTVNGIPAGITVGPDGAIWFAEWNKSRIGRVIAANTDPPVLSIAKTHSGSFVPGQQGATYSVTVSNAAGAGPTAGTVTVTEMLPAGLTLVSMAGTGWNCPGGGTTCTRQDPLPGGSSFAAITVTVDVAPDATSPQVNAVMVAGGGSAPASKSDSTVIDSGTAVGTITEFPVPISSSEPYGIASGPDNALWFTDLQGFIGRMTTAGAVTEAPDNDTNQLVIVKGPDGALWFTDTGNNKIGRITTAGVVTEYATTTSGSAPHYMVVGPDGNLWFTEFGVGKIGRITPDGSMTEFVLPHNFDEPQGITVGPDGALWFTEYHPSANNIGRITTTGVISEFALPTAGANAVGIAAGPDGNLWFTEFTGNKIGQMTPDGVFTEFPLPSAGSQPENMVLGPDGALWFTQRASSQIGRITTGGLISEFNIPTVNAIPAGITVGPDNAIWFTEWNKSRIGRIVQGRVDPPVLGIAVSHQGFFQPGQQGAVYTLNVTNAAGAGVTSGTVTVDNSVTSGLTVATMSGDGWTCPTKANGAPSGSCNRSDVLTPGGNYPAITVTVNVAIDAAAPQVDRATAAGGGSAPASASDAAIVTALSVGSITEYRPPTGASGPDRIVKGSDGALWFTEYSANKIGRLTTTGSFTEYNVLTAASQPNGIAAGPDGALWFTERSGNKIGKITTGGTVSEYNIPTGNSLPAEIVAGPDNALWFTEFGTGKIGRASLTGVVTEFTLPHNFDEPAGITLGPDNALWFTEYHPSANNIGRITITGTITEFALPTAGANAFGIVTGPDGALWFAEFSGNRIGRVTTDGVFNEYPLPTAGSQPVDLVVGADGAVWFTEEGANMIGRIGADGVLVEYPVSTAISQPMGIAVGSDQAIWFAEFNGGKIGHMATGGPVVPVLSITATHAANFQPGGQGAYTVTVSNVIGAGSTSGTASVAETLPPGMTLASITGAGWNCTGAACTRSDALLPGTSYPPLTVTVNVTATQPEEVINQVSVSLAAVMQASAGDLTIIGAFSPCDLTRTGSTSVTDVQLLVNQSLGANARSNDLNGDGIVDVVDVQIAIGGVMGFGCIVQ